MGRSNESFIGKQPEQRIPHAARPLTIRHIRCHLHHALKAALSQEPNQNARKQRYRIRVAQQFSRSGHL